MAISIGNIPYGMQINQQKSEYASTRTIVSDGRVDDAFVSQGASFIGDICDPRVQNFAKTGTGPEGWKADESTGFTAGSQSLSFEDNEVVLRTSVQDNGRQVTHKVAAPYDVESGQVDLESSYEGFRIASSGNTAHFSIPL